MSDNFEPIEDLETCLELRIELKKYKEKGYKHTLAVLRRIKKASLQENYLKKTRITKTIAKLAKLKFEDPSEDEANVLKYSQFLINLWRNRIFERKKFEYPPINYKPKKSEPVNQNGEKKQSQQNGEKQKEKSENNNNSSNGNGSSSNNSKLPDLKTEVRNKAALGINKYLKNLNETSEEKMIQIVMDIEKHIFDHNLKENESDIDHIKKYKQAIKNFCTKLIDSKTGSDICKQITSGEKQFTEFL